LKDKGKGRADPQQWEVISITDDSDMEPDEEPTTNRTYSQMGPQDMEIDNVTAETQSSGSASTKRLSNSVPKRDHRTHIFHFSQALISFTKTHPSLADNLKSYELRREEERLLKLGFNSKVEEGGQDATQVQIASWPTKEGPPLPL
jgi:hypothetical protein